MKYPVDAKWIFTAAILVLLPQITCASGIDIRGINFRDDRPSQGQNMEDAVAEPRADSFAVLRNSADVLIKYPKIKVKVIGFTDDRECRGKDCIRLSLRRARYVLNWLTGYGVSRTQLYGPEGRGSAEPIGDNAIDTGRSQNRRVEIRDASLSECMFVGNCTYKSGGQVE